MGSNKTSSYYLSCSGADILQTTKSTIDPRPFKHFLLSGFTPSQLERRIIAGHLEAVKAERHRLRQERKKIEEALDQVDGELAKLDRFATGLTGAFSNLRHLPTEILQYIFQLAIPEPNGRSQGPRDPPWSISHVCGQWREISISMPSLWTRIQMPCHQKGRDRGSEKRALLYLQRSQRLPLLFSSLMADESMEDFHWKHLGTEENQCGTCRTLTKCSTQIQHLIHYFRHRYDRTTNSYPDFPQLYSFSGFLPPSYPIFLHAPLLQTVELKLNSLSTFTKTQLPWAQLTHFNLHTNAGSNLLGDLLEVLRQCPSLIFFGLKMHPPVSVGDYGGFARIEALQITTLPQVRVMRAISTNYNDFFLLNLLAKLNCPVLESLTVEWYHDAYYQFIIRSHCQVTLTELTVGTASSELFRDKQNFLKFIGELGNLEVLSLYTRPDGEQWYFKNSFTDDICSALLELQSSDTELRIVCAGQLNRPAWNTNSSTSLWHNNLAKYLRQSWNELPALSTREHDLCARRGRATALDIPHRVLSHSINQPLFVDKTEICFLEPVEQSNVKYLCLAA